ncbi:hypothetical protein [Pricia sp.]|uniref:hypothetical protein n=1 Tax=Pricia sp. TaxID=2268138 RepID=UPI003593D712
MKNLMIAAVLALGTMTAFAQEETAVEETATEATEAVEESTEEATEAVEESAEEAVEETTEVAEEATEEVAAQDGFNEVATEEVPEAITAALEEAHPGSSIDKASMNADGQYKLEVTTEDGESAKLYADAEGNWIEM